MRERLGLTAIWTVAAMLFAVPVANAYIDPASTSVVFSALIAGLAAFGTAISMFWSRIIGFFRRDRS